MKSKNEIEKSIIKKFRKTIWKPFIDAINDFNLINDNDVIGVMISGGKDSFLLAKCLEEIKKHGRINFDLKYILMDPGYSEEHLKKVIEVSDTLGIKLHIFKSDIFDDIKQSKNMCYLCARKRRGYLYNEAKALGCNKIALGHHFDDVVETYLMSMIYNARCDIMKPILDSIHYENMKLIRPLYYVREKSILDFKRYNELEFIDCACTVSKNSSSKRTQMKKVVDYLENIYEGSTKNILNIIVKNANIDKNI